MAGLRSGSHRTLVKRARVRLEQIDQVEEVLMLQLPPSNHFEALGGDRREQYSVRVNRQWRICFRWSNGGAEDVEYH